MNRYKDIHQIRDKRKGGAILNSLRLDPGQISNKCHILSCSAKEREARIRGQWLF